MKRRGFAQLVAGTVAWPTVVRAQAARRRRLGILVFSANAQFLTGFKHALRQVGYEEDRNLEILYRDAQASEELADKAARELVQAGAEVIVVWSTTAAEAAVRATRTIPIAVHVADPLGSGLIKSLARPEGNVTGVSAIAFELTGKRADLLMEALPDLRVLGFLGLAGEPNMERFLHIVRGRARPGVEVRLIALSGPSGFEPALATARQAGVEAVVLQQVFDPQTAMLGALVQKLNLPAVAGQRAFAEAGGLMALGAIPEESYRRLAYCVERLLAGVPPGSLPVDQAMRMHFVVNLRAARTLKATILPSLLGRADDVIE